MVHTSARAGTLAESGAVEKTGTEEKPKRYDYQRDINYVPNSWVCEGCPEFDDINGCWAGFERWTDCDMPDPWDLFDDLPDEQGRW